MATTERTILLALDGQWAQAKLEHPRMHPRERVHVAWRTFANTGFAFGDDPRDLVEELGLKLRPSRGDCGKELTTPGTVLYVHAFERRERGLAVFHGLAHRLLADAKWDHTHADVWMLAGDLALPHELCRRRDIDELVRDAHAPEWFVRRWAEKSRRLDARLRNTEAA